MKNAIVTGANGFVGSNLVKALSQKNIHVYAIIKGENANIGNIQWLENVDIIYCDLFHLNELKNKLNDKEIDVFYHLAWAGTSGNTRADYDLQLNNAKAACDAVSVAKKMNVKKFIFAGSVMEYECIEYIPRDDAKPGLGNIYSIGKVAAHFMSKTLACNLGLDYETMIISNIYGPGEVSPRLINTTLLKLIKREETAFTAANQLYDFIYIDDAIRAMILIGDEGKPYCNYYIGNRDQKPLKEFILEMKNCIDKDIELGFGKIRYNGATLSYNEFNTQALYEDLNFEPKVSFTEGIKKTIKWLKNQESENKSAAIFL